MPTPILLTLYLSAGSFAALPATPAVPQASTEATAAIASAIGGDPVSQFLLARRYCLGLGVPMDYSEAAKWFKKAAAQGNADAQCELALLYRLGAGVPKDLKEARKWNRSSAEKGHAEALEALGEMYLYGEGGPRDPVLAYGYFLVAEAAGRPFGDMWTYSLGQQLPPEVAARGRAMALEELKRIRSLTLSMPNPAVPAEPQDLGIAPSYAVNGEAESQYQLGCRFEDGKGVEEDKDKAIEWFLKAAERGHVKAQSKLGDMYRWGRISNLPESAKWFRKAASQGDVDAQIALGELLTEHEEVRDLNEARQWLEQAEASGNDQELCWLARTYTELPGATKNLTAAARCLRKAADRGFPEAQRKLARAYELGSGVPQDLPEAAKWYLEAAQSGDADAQYNLAMMYANGEGVTADPQEAKRWFNAAGIPRKKEKTKEQSLKDEIDYRPVRVAKDKIRAHAYYLLAEASGNPQARSLLEQLEKNMTKNEIAESRAKAELVLKKLKPD